MPWGVAAAIGGALISANASSKASKAQAAASDKALATGDRQYDQTRADQQALLAQQRADNAPYREAGVKSLAELMQLNGPDGEFNRKFTVGDLANDPGYQFRLQEGEAAAARDAAASGNRFSGASLKALSRFNSGLASQEYGAAYARDMGEKTAKYNRVASLAGIGQIANNQNQQAGTSAYGTIAQAGQNNVNNATRSLTDAAEARASGYVATGNAINKGIGDAYNFYASRPQSTTPPPRAGSTGGGDGGEYLRMWGGGG